MSNWKWQRRDKKLVSKKNKIPKHGKNMSKLYSDIINKRLKELEEYGNIIKDIRSQEEIDKYYRKNKGKKVISIYPGEQFPTSIKNKMLNNIKEAKKKLNKEIDEQDTVASQEKLPKYGYGRPSNENFSSFVPEMKEFNLLKAQIKHYIQEGEKPPKGVNIQRGKRGGRFYISSRLRSKEKFTEKDEFKQYWNDEIKNKWKNEVKKIKSLMPEDFTKDLKIRIVHPEEDEYSASYYIHDDIIQVSLDIARIDQYPWWRERWLIRTKYNGELPDTLTAFQTCILHELGHKVSFKSSDGQWKKFFDKAPFAGVTKYSHYDYNERFAESFLYYLEAPKLLKERDPVAYRYMKKLFNGKEFKEPLLKQIEKDILPEGSRWMEDPKTFKELLRFFAKNTIQKEFGTVDSGGFTPTMNFSEKKKKILDSISKLHESKIDEIEDEAEEKEPKTKLQEKILGTVENFEEKMIQNFINEYEKMAILSKEYSNEDLGNLFILAKSLNQRKNFQLSVPQEINRLEQVVFIDGLAHYLHKQKFSDGTSLYKQLDDLADISKSIGEINRQDRLLLLQSVQNTKKIEDMGVDILQKGALLEKSKSLWRLFEKAIKFGVEKLNDRELILLREFIYSKI